MESEDGWVPLGAVGNQLANLASDFDPRTFGFRKLSDLIRKTNAFEIEHPEGGTMRIRIKPSPSGRRRSRARRSVASACGDAHRSARRNVSSLAAPRPASAAIRLASSAAAGRNCPCGRSSQ